MRRFLEVESAHYPDLAVHVASDGQSRFELFNEGAKVDTIHVYKYDIQAIRDLLADLGLKRDESITWEKKTKEAELEEHFRGGFAGKKKEEL